MEIEFIEDMHLYLVDGVITPSVTRIISELICPNKYGDVPEEVMRKASEYGTHVHKAIEDYHKGNIPELTAEETHSYHQYQLLRMKYEFNPICQEQMVSYEGKYAGTYDMIATYKGQDVLMDIKTTSTLDEKSLAWQLGMYKKAINFNLPDEIDINECYCIWIPKKGKGKLVKVEPIPDKEIDALLESDEFKKLCEL